MVRDVPTLITTVTGSIYVLAAFFRVPLFSTIKGHLDKWFLIVTSVTVLVGVINLVMIHGSAIMKRKPGRVQSLVLCLSLAFTIALGLVDTSQGPRYAFLFKNVLGPLGSTTYSLLCFYIASAAYRAFRLRSLDAGLLLAAAVIIMLGSVPIGDAIWSGLPGISAWLLDVPNSAGMRGVMIGATLGAVATACRILLGIERGHLGRGSGPY